ncbi:glycosyltransferase 87 family protein [Streptomyces sp. NBC_00882]|uniref:glycosyltransferase 87 family protein n=1 Tax=Streptomyces TaxID=1883 RepID=UPI003867377E|nr:glycosyltransferase 87 family protein [Streptomyces sp. NBC_00882]WSZ57311.1 glycosyltransferase 87 family protein [Streptomyces canus]
METTGVRRSLTWLLLTWGVTRLLLLLFVFKVYLFPGPDVTSDVSVIYQGWYDVLRTGTFPQSDVTWQYPPAAALAILSPALLPFLEYTQAFFLMAFAADLAALLLLLYAGLRPGRRLRGAWVWVAGVPLLGPTVYSRYDVMVTAVAVAAVLAAARHPKVAGALVGFGALLKVWPALILVGIRRRSVWASAAVTVVVVAGLFSVAMPGAFAFLTFQRERGTEVESLGSLVFHVARHHGWDGSVLLNYGSVEFLGPWVTMVSTAALALTGMAFGLLLLWRLAATRFEAHTAADAALMAVLMFTTTSRVISPQYMVWLVGLAAACLCFRASRMGVPAVLVLMACFVTVLEFPIWFADVVGSTPRGIVLLVARNGLLVLATVIGMRELWKATVRKPAPAVPMPDQTEAPAQEASASS